MGDILDSNNSNNSNNIFATNDDKNFFSSYKFNNLEYYNNPEASRRLNDYDFNLLKDEAYRDINDELLKLEYKISSLEKELSTLDAQIQSARDINDYNLVEYFINRKQLLNNDLAYFNYIYNEKSVSSRVVGGFNKLFLAKLKNFVSYIRSIVDSIKNYFILLLPDRFSSVIEIKASLSKLQNINKSVDELMSMQIPYGEADCKYEQLSKYIVRANAIQAKISKSIK